MPLRRQCGAAQEPRFPREGNSLLGSHRLGRAEPLQGQFRLAAIDVKDRVE